MVRLGGIEPPTSGSTNLRSNQLSYNRTSSQFRCDVGEIRGLRIIFKSYLRSTWKKAGSGSGLSPSKA
jgi:hypothetical protein